MELGGPFGFFGEGGFGFHEGFAGGQVVADAVFPEESHGGGGAVHFSFAHHEGEIFLGI